MKFYVFLAIIFSAQSVARAQSFTGSFTAQGDDGTVRMKLVQQKDGTVTGTIAGGGESGPITGKLVGSKFVGTSPVANGQGSVNVIIRRDGAKLVMEMSYNGNSVPRLVFTRLGGASSTAGTPHSPAKASKSNGSAAPATGVYVNDQQLSRATVQRLEQKFGIRIFPGRYWYDKKCGAVGHQGGPTVSIAPAGMDIGGKLKSDASNGDTGVFVNGRQIHRLELIALQQLGPVQRGRVWLDAQGNYGKEGGPRLGNIVAAAQARQVPRQGILSTWDRTGVAVYDLR